MKPLQNRIRHYCIVLSALVSLLAAGCGGLQASKSISPLDFLLPGAGHLLHLKNDVPNGLTPTNTLVAAYPVTAGGGSTANCSP